MSRQQDKTADKSQLNLKCKNLQNARIKQKDEEYREFKKKHCSVWNFSRKKTLSTIDS